jgi:hypothetical protein
VGVVWWSAVGPEFRLARVTVRGTRLLTVSEIEAALGLSGDPSILWLNLEGLCRMLEREERVASAGASRRLPDTVEIAVRERPPVAVLADGTNQWDLDRTGQVLGPRRADSACPEVHPVTPEDELRIRWTVSLLEAADRNGLDVADVAFEAVSHGVVVRSQYPFELWLPQSRATAILEHVPRVAADLRGRQEAPRALDCRFSGQIVAVFPER